MTTAREIIQNILDNELPVIAEGKRNKIVDRIVEELQLENHAFLSKDDLKKSFPFNPSK